MTNKYSANVNNDVSYDEQSGSLNSQDLPPSESYLVYTKRWYILAMFCSLEIGNALMWVTFSPISDLTSHYFGSSNSDYGSATAVNMLANIFLILYPFGTLFAVYLMNNYGPRKALIYASILTLVGAFVRYLAAVFKNNLGIENTYILMMLGQSLSAIAQPVFVNFPAAISGAWFAVSERDISTTIGAMSSPIGNAIGQLFPVLFVSESLSSRAVASGDDDQYDVHGMDNLMLSEFVFIAIPLIFALIWFTDAPPTPPSHSTKLKIMNAESFRYESDSTGASSSSYATMSTVKTVKRNTWEDVRQLFANKDYMLLFLVFSVGLGFFNSVMTLLNQIVLPFGYSNDDAGTFGAVFIVCGLLGAGVAGKLLEVTKAYRTMLRGGLAIACCSVIFFLCMLYSNNFPLLLFSFAILGFSVLPLLPIMMENCAEVTYPIPEELSNGIIITGANLLGLVFIFALQFLLNDDPLGPPPFLPSNFFMFAILFFAAFLLIFYRGEYRRSKYENAHSDSNSKFKGIGEDEEGDTDSSAPLLDQDFLVRVTSQDNSSNGTLRNPSLSNRSFSALRPSSFFQRASVASQSQQQPQQPQQPQQQP